VLLQEKGRIFLRKCACCHTLNWQFGNVSHLNVSLLFQRPTVKLVSRPPTSSSLRITNRSFRYASPLLWNQLRVSFRQPRTKHSADDVTLSNSPPTCSPLSSSITHSLFHSRLKTDLFHKSFPP